MPNTTLVEPIYNITKGYIDNVIAGPCFDGPLPERTLTPESQWMDFMGFRVVSPLGIPAGPLLNSQWVELAAKLGYDVVTYKTIRSQAFPGHPLPNVIYVGKHPENPQMAMELQHVPSQVKEVTITNSFGMPSMAPEFLQEDIVKARECLSKGQLLIVSVVGTPGFSKTLEDDFVKAAMMAKEAGAPVIEANFSCPNVSSKDGVLFCDHESSYQIASSIAKAIGPTPLMIKVGRYTNRDTLRKVLIGLAKANVRGVCGINSVSMRVVKENDMPALGQGRETSGICGNMIRPMALEFVKDAHEIIHKEKLGLELVGCGGITQTHHFDEILKAGSTVAMTATGMMWDPYLASKWHQKKRYQT